jgi:TfoX/Sxy family transcriptional regulator of competence genes
MATTVEFIEFVCSQIDETYQVRYRKMFGEYMVYANNKPILLVCDNTVYVKILPELTGLLAEAEKGFPYQGAREHYILDAEDRELCNYVVQILELLTPIPVKKVRKRKKTVGEI